MGSELCFGFLILGVLTNGLIGPEKGLLKKIINITIWSLLLLYGIVPYLLGDEQLTQLGTLIIAGATLLAIKIQEPLMRTEQRYNYEFIVLQLMCVVGMLYVIKAQDLIGLYLAVELQSMGMYVMAAYGGKSRFGTEGGLKYYIMGGLMSSIQLLGIAIVYGISGQTEYTNLLRLLITDSPNLAEYAMGLVICGLIFKIGGAPFHQWAPDVYQGAPLASTLFMSIVPKISIIIGLYRMLLICGETELNVQNEILIAVSVLSLLIGTLQALTQKNLKRLLAYSSISNVGFIVVGLLTDNWEATLQFIVIYMLTSLGVFAMVVENKVTIKGGEAYYKIVSLLNKSRQQPLHALGFSILLFSLAGIPPLLGFFAKFYILKAAILENYVILSLIGILASAISAVYYIYLIQLQYFYPKMSYQTTELLHVSSKSNTWMVSSVVILLMVLNIVLI